MAGPLRILILEDSALDAELEVQTLEDTGCACTWERVQTREEFLARLEAPRYDLIFADYNLPAFDGLTALALLRERDLDIPFILISGTLGEERAIESFKAGATDYVMKGRLERLRPVVDRALQERAEHQRREQAETARQQEAQVSAALVRVGRELIASLDAPLILERLCAVTTEVLECDASWTLLWQKPEDRWMPIAGCGLPPEQWEAWRALTLPGTVFAGVLERLEREDIFSAIPAESAHPVVRRLAQELHTGVLLHMALRRDGQIVGLHSAFYCGGQNAIAPWQERIGRGIAQLGSMALTNARLVEELGEASRLKTEFLATMSHELRTPLNAIIGYNDMLLDPEFGQLDAEQLDLVQQVRRASCHLLELVSATLDISRLDKGELPVDEKEVSLAEFLGQVESQMRGLSEKPSVRLTWEAGPRELRLRTDPVKLRVALKNIIDNGVKFTDQGSVTVAVRERNDGVEFTVSDTGIGIAPEHLVIIFEPFRQVDSSFTRRHGGLGLGLYVARRLVETLGGTISIESEVDRGSVFRLWLPLRVPRDSHAGVVHSQAA